MLFSRRIECNAFPDGVPAIRYEGRLTPRMKLIVSSGQAAVVLQDGEISGVFTPGRYSVFAEKERNVIYFVNTRPWLPCKWGTSNAVDVHGADYRLRAHGMAVFVITAPSQMIQAFDAMGGSSNAEALRRYAAGVVAAAASVVLAENPEYAADYAKLSESVQNRAAAQLTEFGVAISKLIIENVSRITA